MGNEKGLSGEEASALLKSHGFNEIAVKPRQTPLQIFVSQFKSILAVLLILASLASLFLGDLVDGVLILLIIAINGILGFIQEYKAEQAIAALGKMTVSSARVVRDGIEQKIESRELVPGDIIILEQGDKIPADCTLVHSTHFEVNEASLTGESLSVEKNHEKESTNKIFLGTIVAKGRGRAFVTTTGMQTRFGQIAKKLSKIEDTATPLEKKINTLAKQLGFLALMGAITVFIVGYLYNHPLVQMVFTSISLAVAAVPEGLPTVITITLAVGMQRMARKKAIMRRLSSIEALGSITVIATDKTGTLTQNQMRVSKVWLNDSSDKTERLLLEAGVLCNNASLVKNNDKKLDFLGDTTEGSLLLYAASNDVDVEKLRKSGKLIEEFAFDPALKLMSVLWEKNGEKYVYTKGSYESILTVSKNVDTEEIEKIHTEFASDGLRVIAVAYKKVHSIPKNRKEAEDGLVFLGLVGIADPPRDEVTGAIKIARLAGIRTIMITGDNELTARAIASKIGLLENGDEIITGKQLKALTDSELLNKLDLIRIFARTTPEQKLRLVTLLQKQGHIVAVTGDGVNDALALKQADVGVSMGITGTDVAKEASDMILTDDNYATLVTAIAEGRTIYTNIKASVKYLVGSNTGEVITVVTGIFLGLPLIFSPIHLLYINLVSDGLPAISLAMMPKHAGIMKGSVVRSKSMFDRYDKIWFFEVNFITVIITILSFIIGLATGSIETARTMAFSIFVFAQSFILLDVWHLNRSILGGTMFKSFIFLLAFLTPFILQLLLIYNSTLITLFKLSPLSITQLLYVISLSSILLFVAEVRKVLINR